MYTYWNNGEQTIAIFTCKSSIAYRKVSSLLTRTTYDRRKTVNFRVNRPVEYIFGFNGTEVSGWEERKTTFGNDVVSSSSS